MLDVSGEASASSDAGQGSGAAITGSVLPACGRARGTPGLQEGASATAARSSAWQDVLQSARTLTVSHGSV